MVYRRLTFKKAMSALEVDTRKLHAGWDYRRQEVPGDLHIHFVSYQLKALSFHFSENMHT